ncbi:MAG: hypothetical protein ACR2MD_10400 [Aridibacter sp.]
MIVGAAACPCPLSGCEKQTLNIQMFRINYKLIMPRLFRHTAQGQGQAIAPTNVSTFNYLPSTIAISASVNS